MIGSLDAVHTTAKVQSKFGPEILRSHGQGNLALLHQSQISKRSPLGGENVKQTVATLAIASLLGLGLTGSISPPEAHHHAATAKSSEASVGAMPRVGDHP